MSEAANLTCGVCGDLFRNPYLLPCDHSFCRRPCLLPTPSTIYARCIYCHIEVHVSELEQSYKLNERVQRYLAKGGNLGAKLVLCNLCRSLHEHCTTCSHCDRQLCDLCFKEHGDEFHTGFRMQLQRLRNEASELKQARAILVSRRTTGKTQQGQLLKHIEGASSDLQSACKTALSRADERLDRAETETEACLLAYQKLIRLAVELRQALRYSDYIEDPRSLCEMKRATKSAIETLRSSEDDHQCHKLETFTLADSLGTIGAQLFNLQLFVDGRLMAVATGAKMGLPSNSLNQTFSAHDTASNPVASIRNEPNVDREPLLSTYQPERTKQKASDSTTPAQQQSEQQNQQQQMDIQDLWAAEKSQEPITFFVDGVKATTTEEDLETHFASFGEVLELALFMNPKTNRHNGRGYVILWPTVNQNTVLYTKHIVHGVRINVYECGSSDEEEEEDEKEEEEEEHISVRSEYNVDREPLLSKYQPERTKQKASSSRTPAQKQEQQSEQQSQQQKMDMQDLWAAGRSQQPTVLFVNGVKANVTTEDLKTHFTSFGEVLDVAMCINPKTNRHNGAGHITLRSTVDVNQILDTEHIILDVRMNVRKSKRHLDEEKEEEEEEKSEAEEEKKEGGEQISMRSVPNVDRKPLLSKYQPERNKQEASSSTTPAQQQSEQQTHQPQIDIQDLSAAGRSRQPTVLFVDGVKVNIMEEHLETHFASYGEVLGVVMYMNPKTNRHNGRGYIILWPTGDLNRILDSEHHVCGVRINVYEFCLSDDEEDEEDEEVEKEEGEHISVSSSLESPRIQKAKEKKSSYVATGPTIFVGGIKRTVSLDAVREYFSQFGCVVEVRQAVKPYTGAKLAYGFLTFAENTDVTAILASKIHSCGGVNVAVRPYDRSKDPQRKGWDHDLMRESARIENEEKKSTDIANGPTIFVGGIKYPLSLDTIRDYFSRFGCVAEVKQALSPYDGDQLAYGFVTFAKNTDVTAILASKRHDVDGVNVDVRPYDRSKYPHTNWIKL